MTWRATVLTLFPEMFPGPLGVRSPAARCKRGRWSFEAANIRDHATDRHRTVDDTPFGGGAGMVLRPDVADAALEAAPDGRPLVCLTPRGAALTQARVRSFAAGPGIVLLCGRYEGIDQRVIEARGLQEVSIGDYVLSGGELAAMVLLDAAVRLCRVSWARPKAPTTRASALDCWNIRTIRGRPNGAGDGCRTCCFPATTGPSRRGAGTRPNGSRANAGRTSGPPTNQTRMRGPLRRRRRGHHGSS